MMTSTQTMLRNFVSITIFSTALLLSGNAAAQLNQQTGVADPGRIEKQLTDERLVPQGGPRISVKEMVLVEPPPGAEKIKFNFGGLRINGADVYSKEQLYSLYEDKIGKEITLADLYGIANQVTLKYRNDGYILTQVVVPPQTIDDGIVKLQVVEGFIDNVLIQGGDATDSELEIIEKYAGRISQGGALNVSSMEHNLLLINDLAGVDARSVISPSQTTQGAADLLIIIERDPFEAQVGVNNHGSRFLGPVQFDGLAYFNSLFGLNEQITAQTVVAPDAGIELAFGFLEYEQPIGPYGTSIAIGGGITNTDPGFTLSQFDVKGSSQNIFIGVNQPIIRSRSTNLSAHASLASRNVDSKNNVEPTRKDRIRSLRAGLRAEFLDRLLGVAVNTINLDVARGLDIFGASDKGDANLTRAAGDPQFTKFNAQIQRLQRVTSSVNVLLSGRAQLSNDPLLSSEEFGLGGISTVRGFDPSEVVGDDGIAGKIEVQWNTPTKILQLFGFLDSGTVWNQDATSSAAKRNSLTSTGIGARVDLPMDVNAELVAAQPLNRNIQTQGERDPQFFFSLNKKF